MKKYRAKAHSNIALIKYWGKENEEIIIPNNNSLSLTLDALYTETEVSFTDETSDIFYLNDKLQDEVETAKISKYIDLFRNLANSNKNVLVKSFNYVPTAAGLASSASGFAALAMALNRLFELNLESKQVSKLARRGSGSAVRSIYGGFVEWEKGYDHDSSYSVKIDDANFDIAMIIIVINSRKKSISSRIAMKETIKTSPLYPAFVESSREDIRLIKEAIYNRDLEKIGQIAEHNAMKMHATMLGANPPIIYFEEKSIKALTKIRELREKGYIAYATMDAGPNVKIICKKSEADKIIKDLEQDFENIILSFVGEDAKVWEAKND